MTSIRALIDSSQWQKSRMLPHLVGPGRNSFWLSEGGPPVWLQEDGKGLSKDECCKQKNKENGEKRYMGVGFMISDIWQKTGKGGRTGKMKNIGVYKSLSRNYREKPEINGHAHWRVDYWL